MSAPLTIECANTILYCSRWQECVDFHRDGLGLDVVVKKDWYVEFSLTAASRLSIAEARRASVESAAGWGITLTLKVQDILAAYQALLNRGLSPGKVKKHAWGADVFYLRDPDGNRIEFWSERPVSIHL